MTSGIRTIIYPVKDLLGRGRCTERCWVWSPTSISPSHVGFRVGDQEIGLDPNGHRQGLTGPVGYCHVDDIETSLKQLLDSGAEIQQEVRDVGGGRLIARVKDADGNVTGLLQSS